jgi:hypothetical protein
MKTLARLGVTAARYAAWLALSALGLWAVLEVRINIFDTFIYAGISKWALPAADKFMTVPLILLWLAGVFVLEAYLMAAKDERLFWRRAGAIAVAEGVILAVSYLLQALM